MKTLLLTGSSRTLMDLSKRKLERAGYSVYCADGVAEAADLVSSLAPDGIFLINNFHDGNGIELCRELRKACAIPIIYSSNSKDDELPALQAGANDFIKKPFDFEILTARVDIMLNTKVGVITGALADERSGIEPGADANSVFDADSEPAGLQNAISPQNGSTQHVTKRTLAIRSKYIIAAACIIVAIIAAGIIIALNDRVCNTEIGDTGVPLAEMPIP